MLPAAMGGRVPSAHNHFGIPSTLRDADEEEDKPFPRGFPALPASPRGPVHHRWESPEQPHPRRNMGASSSILIDSDSDSGSECSDDGHHKPVIPSAPLSADHAELDDGDLEGGQNSQGVYGEDPDGLSTHGDEDLSKEDIAFIHLSHGFDLDPAPISPPATPRFEHDDDLGSIDEEDTTIEPNDIGSPHYLEDDLGYITPFAGVPSHGSPPSVSEAEGSEPDDAMGLTGQLPREVVMSSQQVKEEVLSLMDGIDASDLPDSESLIEGSDDESIDELHVTSKQSVKSSTLGDDSLPGQPAKSTLAITVSMAASPISREMSPESFSSYDEAARGASRGEVRASSRQAGVAALFSDSDSDLDSVKSIDTDTDSNCDTDCSTSGSRDDDSDVESIESSDEENAPPRKEPRKDTLVCPATSLEYDQGSADFSRDCSVDPPSILRSGSVDNTVLTAQSAGGFEIAQNLPMAVDEQVDQTVEPASRSSSMSRSASPEVEPLHRASSTMLDLSESDVHGIRVHVRETLSSSVQDHGAWCHASSVLPKSGDSDGQCIDDSDDASTVGNMSSDMSGNGSAFADHVEPIDNTNVTATPDLEKDQIPLVSVSASADAAAIATPGSDMSSLPPVTPPQPTVGLHMPTVASNQSTPTKRAREDDLVVKPAAQRRRLLTGENMGMLALGAALGAVGTVAGLMQLAPQ